MPVSCWREHLKVGLIGHKDWSRHQLADVTFKPGQPELCSSYVAKVFLQAVHDTNLKMKELGYQETIAHPFGEHEIVEHMDPVRVLYFWKRHNICRLVPPHPTIVEVILR